MHQPTNVEIVRESASLLGPILIAAGAVLAAGLTVMTANLRHRSQLLHDRDLQRDQLKHDRELRDQQLRQDRELRYREHVFHVLDQAIESAEELDGDLWRLARIAKDVERERADQGGETGSPAAETEVPTRFTDLERTLIKNGAKVYRQLAASRRKATALRLRLGPHEIYQKLSEFLDRIEERIHGLDTVDDRNRIPDEIGADKEAEEAVEDAQAVFLLACQRWHTAMNKPGVAAKPA